MHIFYGMFLAQHTEFWVITAITAFFIMGFMEATLLQWTVLLAILLAGFHGSLTCMIFFLVIAVVFNFSVLRRYIVSAPVMKSFKIFNFFPKISDTERIALEAGDVWVEASLFSGKPDFKRLMNQPASVLTEEEQAFLYGPVEELCKMLNDWEIWKTRKLPEQVWSFIKSKGFLGLIIPKEYGGLGFSSAANSAVVQKIASRSISAAVCVMVPNSLGPAELLVHYGTQRQKEKYLPRLAIGEEIPCFALTEPNAGSDAASITSEGTLFKDDNGEICITLDWKKRWITLGSIATLLGIAFRLRDPDNIMGKGENLGITCALVPSFTKGVISGKRHDPMGVPFHNCPLEGNNVVVKAEDAIIGGLAGAGMGWKMLMEALGAGRGISLPAQSLAGIKMAFRVASAHSVIREQFGSPISKFEGVEEPLARIGGATYYMDAMRNYVLGALDQKLKPSIVTAMSKYHATEQVRKSVNDAMDILGGKGISMGPKNPVVTTFIGIPISITVEGANILTRTLMIFGQGMIRSHPYVQKELGSLRDNDLKAFDESLWGHFGHITRNKSRAIVLSLTRGWLADNGTGGVSGRYFQKLSWASACFAFMTDVVMMFYGGNLKKKEKLTGRFADIYSWMFIGIAALVRFEKDGRMEEDLPFFHYSMQTALYNIQKAFEGIFQNIEIPLLKYMFKGPLSCFIRLNSISRPPSDALTHEIVHLMTNSSIIRDRLTNGIHISSSPDDYICKMEQAFKMISQTGAAREKIKNAMRSKKIPGTPVGRQIHEAFDLGIINKNEFLLLQECENLKWQCIQVDEFTEDEYLPASQKE